MKISQFEHGITIYHCDNKHYGIVPPWVPGFLSAVHPKIVRVFIQLGMFNAYVKKQGRLEIAHSLLGLKSIWKTLQDIETRKEQHLKDRHKEHKTIQDAEDINILKAQVKEVKEMLKTLLKKP